MILRTKKGDFVTVEFSQMAQDFVEATSALVGKRTINIMDLKGIIIASTEKERIGSFHQGAAEVIETHLPVIIHKEDLSRYPGAKEGYNLPIMLAGKMIGVVGIYGEEDEVRDIANLLKVYVIQYFEQQSNNQKQKFESGIRNQVLARLISGNHKQEEEVNQLCRIIDVRIQYPAKLLMFSAIYYKYTPLHQYAQLEQQLRWNDIISEKDDVFGIYNSTFLLFCSETKDILKIKMFLENHKEYQLSISGTCTDIEDIPRALREVSVLNQRKGGQISTIEKYEDKLTYLMGMLLHQDGEHYAREMERRLKETQDKNSEETLLETACVYYQEGGSVTKAALRLHLHKNTLLYRMNRIYNLLGLEDEPVFVREFFIKLLLKYHPVQTPEEENRGY